MKKNGTNGGARFLLQNRMPHRRLMDVENQTILQKLMGCMDLLSNNQYKDIL